MPPVPVAPGPAFWRWLRLSWVTREPAVDLVMVILLAPEQSREDLTLDTALVGRECGWLDSVVEGVGLGLALGEVLVEVGEWLRQIARREAELNDPRLPWLYRRREVRGHLAAALAIGRALIAMNDEVVDPILHIGRGVRGAKEQPVVGLVLAEEEVAREAACRARVKITLAERGMRRAGRALARL